MNGKKLSWMFPIYDQTSQSRRLKLGMLPHPMGAVVLAMRGQLRGLRGHHRICAFWGIRKSGRWVCESEVILYVEIKSNSYCATKCRRFDFDKQSVYFLSTDARTGEATAYLSYGVTVKELQSATVQ